MGEGESANKLVLIVDDESSICSMLNHKLTSSGFACWTCTSGRAALEKLERDSVALVLSDLRMPGMSGMDLLKHVQRISPHTKFMMITGEDDIRVGIQAMKQGAADYLVKPLQLASVVASVERAMEMRRLELEVENYRQNLEGMVQDRTRQLQSALKHVELTYEESLEALGAAIDLRDSETAGHSQRVSRYSLEIAKVVGCTAEQLKNIARGAYLHDIGKIGIPDAILLKPGKLSEEERAVMETHVRIGYELVCRVAFLAGAAEIVLTHQECFDGSGYPQGLLAEEIPLGARIFAVADTLDAITSDRPYRRAVHSSLARAEIARESGRQFDPKVVQAFLSIPEWVWEKIRSEVARGLTAPRATLAPNLGGELPAQALQVVRRCPQTLPAQIEFARGASGFGVE
jgi:putative nucleotidyltransferase with HDIG domain